jgi:hypothetical protein
MRFGIHPTKKPDKETGGVASGFRARGLIGRVASAFRRKDVAAVESCNHFERRTLPSG